MASGNLIIEDSALRRRLDKIETRADNLAPVWTKFAQYMRVRTDRTFDRLRHGNRVFRQTAWRYFAPQYTRADGTVVPAWGGIPKVRGQGLVKGRLRPSGARVREGDSVVQDTGTLRARAALVVLKTGNELRLGTNLNYARRQQDMRRFLFFEVPQDTNFLLKLAAEHAIGE